MAKKTKTKTENWLKLAAPAPSKTDRLGLCYAMYYPDRRVIIAGDGYRIHADWASDDTTSDDWHRLAGFASEDTHGNTYPLRLLSNMPKANDGHYAKPPMLDALDSLYDTPSNNLVQVSTKEFVRSINLLSSISTDGETDSMYMVVGRQNNVIHMRFDNKETGDYIQTSVPASMWSTNRWDTEGVIRLNLKCVLDAVSGMKHNKTLSLYWGDNGDVTEPALLRNGYTISSTPLVLGEYGDRMAVISGQAIKEEEYVAVNKTFVGMDDEVINYRW